MLVIETAASQCNYGQIGLNRLPFFPMLDIKRGCTVKFIARAFKKTDN